jgi:hypothetical protein
VDHNRLTIEQRAEVVFFTETMTVTATHRFRDVFRTRWAPARNILFYRNSEEEVRRKKNDLGPSALRLPENVAALQTDFVPQLKTTQLPIGTQWLIQDGATPYTAMSCWIF